MRGRPVDVPDREIIRLYVEDRKTMKQVAFLCGISVGYVFKVLKRNDIKTRSAAEVNKGFKHSEEFKKRMSLINKGKKMSEESKKKLSQALKKGGVGHKKIRGDGYVYIYFPDHPNATKDGYIMEHVLVMEALIGRHLGKDEVVHHKNKQRDDNRKENLVLMTFKEHSKLHIVERRANSELKHHTVKVRNIDTKEEFCSVKEAAQKYDVASTNISRACRSSYRKVRGYSWEYIQEGVMQN